MQNVIRKRARAREARLPGGGRFLGNGSFFRSAGRRVASTDGSVPHRPVENSDRVRRSVELIGTPLSFGWMDATGHHRVTRARREGSTRGAEIGKLANG